MAKLVQIAVLVVVLIGQMLTPQSSSDDRKESIEKSGAVAVSISANREPETTKPVAREVCDQPEQVIATMLDGYIVFVSATPIHAGAREWPAEQMKAMERIYGDVILNGYTGSRGFGSVTAWARAFGITQVPATCPGPDCCNAGGALRFMYVPDKVNLAGWYDYPSLGRVAAIQTGCPIIDCPAIDVAYHELAHLWDFRHVGRLSAELDTAMDVVRDAERQVDVNYYYGRRGGENYLPTGQPPVQRHGDFPSTYFNSRHPAQPAGGEHFAETVAAYFLIEQEDRYDYPICWSDEDPRCPTGREYEYDRYDFMQGIFERAAAADGGVS